MPAEAEGHGGILGFHETGFVATGFVATGFVATGFVATGESAQLEGWAFDPANPGHAVQVQLRLGEAILANCSANIPRPDLARAGLGIAMADADHGFRFALRPEWVERRSALTVLAVGANGAAAWLPPLRRGPLVASSDLPSPAQMVQAIDRLFATQRALDSRLQALVPVAQEAPAEAQGTEQRLATLEAWVARLDSRLAALPASPAIAMPSGLDTWQIVLLALLGLCSLGALVGFALVLAL